MYPESHFRDHLLGMKLKFLSQVQKEEKATGVGGEEPLEYDTLLKELIKLSKDNDEKYSNNSQRQTDKKSKWNSHINEVDIHG